MKTFRSLSLAGLAVCAFAVSMPALAHDGYFYGHGYYGRPHFGYPGHRVVIVRPPVFVPRPVVVYRPGPVYYTPVPVYYAAPAPGYYPRHRGTTRSPPGARSAARSPVRRSGAPSATVALAQSPPDR